MFWEKDIGFHVLEKNEQVLHGVFNMGTPDEWELSIVYGNPNLQKRRVLWDKLGEIHKFNISRWCFCGDFNATLHHGDRISRARSTLPPDKGFKEWVYSHYLKELHASGPQFTWGREGCMSKIDWVFMNEEWVLKFPDASAVHLPKHQSDHCPILLKIQGGARIKGGKRDFRFFAPWVTHSDFPNVVKRSWVSSR